MSLSNISCGLLAGLVVALSAPAAAQEPSPDTPASAASPSSSLSASTERPSSPSEALLQALEPEVLRALGAEVLERSPEIARARQLAAAAAARAPQVRALPDPVAALTLFVLPPETRVGPQRLSASVQQKLPWFGKLALKEQAALYAAAAAVAEVETIRLDQITEARRLAYELAFLDGQQSLLRVERSALARYEEASQARYSAGSGLQQEVVRVQAQITRMDTRLLEVAERRVALLAALNGLRDRPADVPLGSLELPDPVKPIFDREILQRWAEARRPELAAADARIAAGQAMLDLAGKSFRPDVTLGMSYTSVGGREDAPGRMNPPPDNGDDIVALSGSLNLPVWRRALEAGVAEAQATRWAAEEDKRRTLTRIESSIGDLTARMPLLFEHLGLLESVLLKQARQAMGSAETAYSTGRLNAVDLLDAEVVLFDVQIAAQRVRTDLAVARAQLERAVAGPLNASPFESDDGEPNP